MNDIDTQCLEAFPQWLDSLAGDVSAFAELLLSPGVDVEELRVISGALNYFLKYTDLIPDGLDDLGYLDDALVLRAAAAALSGALALDASGRVSRLAKEASLVREFLGSDYARLQRLVETLCAGQARGRTVDAIVSDAELRQSVQAEVSAWSEGYQAPPFSRDEKTLIKLRAFLTTKLPTAATGAEGDSPPAEA